MQSLIDNLRALPWPESKLDEAVEETKKLRDMNVGWEHVVVSSKLTFLDKLLRQLHHENMEFCTAYKDEYVYERANKLRKAIQERRSKLDDLLATTTSSTSSNKSSPEAADSNMDVPITMQRLRRELDILEKPEEDGGGLNGLEGNLDVAFSRPKTNLFVKYLHPWDPHQDDPIKTSSDEFIKTDDIGAPDLASLTTPDLASLTTPALPASPHPPNSSIGSPAVLDQSPPEGVKALTR